MRYRRAVTNIVATMLIFALMISSMAVLYSQISPVLLGYNSRTATTNQEYILGTIANEVLELVSSTAGSQTRVHISSADTEYTISTGVSLITSVNNDGSPLHTYTESIGLFTGIVSGTFQTTPQATYLNKVSTEGSYIMNDTLEDVTSYVAKGDFTLTQATFTLYFRSRVNVIETNPGEFLMTITTIKLIFLDAGDGSPVNFPVSLDEWTLRLRRNPSEIVTETTLANAGLITLSQTIDGVAGTTYSFPSITGGSITVRHIVVPILLSI